MKRVILFQFCLGLISIVGMSANGQGLRTAQSFAQVVAHFEGAGFRGTAQINSPNLRQVAEFDHSAQDRFLIGSVTKQFTAAAILKLVEQGRIDLQSPVVRYVPTFRFPAVTIHHLLTHTSGILDFTQTDEFNKINTTRFENLTKLLELVLSLPQNFTEGIQWDYSNSNYNLLSYIIEVASGESWWSFVRRELILPAGMLNTDFIFDRGLNLVDGHNFDADYNLLPLQPEEYFERGWAHGAGGLESTSDDLVRWNESLYGGKILQSQSLALMITKHAQIQPNLYSGYGLMIGQDPQTGETVISHNGGIPGFASFNSYYPDRKLSVIVLSNVISREAVDLGNSLSSLEVKGQAELPVLIDSGIATSQPLGGYAGEFTSPQIPFSLQLILKNGFLYLSLPGIGQHRLIRRQADVLYDRALGAELKLSPTATDRFELRLDGQVFEFLRRRPAP